MAGFDIDNANQVLREKFAPWIQELQITFDALGDGEATLRVPALEQFNRVGGTVCGQAIMALADTAMVFAVSSSAGGFVPMTTVTQTSSFLRPASAADLVARARIIKRGRSLVYGEVNVYTDAPDKPVAHITSSYMLL